MNTIHRPSEEELQELLAKGFESHQHGHLDEACRCYRTLLEYFPQLPVLHYNLGLVFYEQQRYQHAKESFDAAFRLAPHDVDVLFNLALSHKKLGDLEGAINIFKQVLDADPESLDTLYNLAGCYRERHQYAEAIDTYLELLRYAPDHPSANNNLAYVYQLTGKRERAIFHYAKVLEVKPEHVSARHMLAALSGSAATSSPDSYVTEIFDNYSEKYEQSLVRELEYCVPATLRTLLDRTRQIEKHYTHGLDLGCGTGLGGETFSDVVEMLSGIDLSQKMLDLAAKKNIYHTLYCAHIVDFLKSSAERFDFYLGADVFGYVGDLEEMFNLLRKRSRSQAVLCFSTERGKPDGFQLQESGRFAHSPHYIEDLAMRTGWQIATTTPHGLRKEKGAWVQGDLWVLQLPLH